MPIPDTGTVSLADIQTEFGGSNPISMGEYYKGGGIVQNNAANTDIPSSGTIDINDFRGGGGVANRDVRVRMSYLFNENGYGLTTQSSTGSPSSISPSANAIAWQPVFHAGTGFITSASINIGQNEDTAANTGHVILYGGLTSSTVTNIVAQWNAGFNGSTGGDRSYSISWNADGTINSITYTGGNYNVGIITWATDNVSSANSAGYKWFGFRVKNPSSFGKGARILNGTFDLSSNTTGSLPQPT